MSKWLVLMCYLLMAGSVQADMRVLFRFDSAGHYVHRIFQVERPQNLPAKQKKSAESINRAENTAPVSTISAIERGRSWSAAAVPPVRMKQSGTMDGFAKLIWFDTAGLLLTQTEASDPRVVHSPSHAEGINASRNGLTSGAWLVSAPDSASRVTIVLPESVILGLGAETWNLNLVP